MTITEFLLARIAEDEAVAFRARGTGYDLGCRLAVGEREGNDSGVEIAPDRVLAECAAKRRIVEEHVLDAGLEDAEPGCRICSEVSHYDGGRYSTGWPCETLAALASVYAEHRDYDPAWRDAGD